MPVRGNGEGPGAIVGEDVRSVREMKAKGGGRRRELTTERVAEKRESEMAGQGVEESGTGRGSGIGKTQQGGSTSRR